MVRVLFPSGIYLKSKSKKKITTFCTIRTANLILILLHFNRINYRNYRRKRIREIRKKRTLIEKAYRKK